MKKKLSIVTEDDCSNLSKHIGTLGKLVIDEATSNWNILYDFYLPESYDVEKIKNTEITRNLELEQSWNQTFSKNASKKVVVGKFKQEHILSKEDQEIAFLKYNYLRSIVVDSLRSFRAKQDVNSIKDCIFYGKKALDVRQYIFSYNCGLIFQMIKRANGYVYNEILSNSTYVLLSCIDKFDISKGFQFSTYVTRSLHTNVFTKRNVSSRPGISLNDDFVHPVHLDDNENKEDIDHITKIIKDNDANLSEVELIVLKGRIYEDKTLDEISKQINKTKERVRQIQNQVFEKIRKVW